MPLLILNILFALLSVALYVGAPGGFDHAFCSLILGVYLVQNMLWLMLQGSKRRLRFELFFMLSFLFVNFVYPVCYAESYPHWFFYAHPFNRHIINQATAMAYMAYAWYMLGISDRPWHQQAEPTTPRYTITRQHMLLLTGISILSFGAFVATGGYTALMKVYSAGGDLREVGVFSYFGNIFSVTSLLMAAFVFQLPNRRERLPFLALLGLYVLVFLSTGSRQFSIRIILILMVSFSLYIYRLKGWQVVLATLIGVVMLFAIMLFRSDGLDVQAWQDVLAAKHWVSPLDIFSDLTINSLNLYVLTEWGNTHPLTWLQGVLVDLTSPIPKLGTWVIERYGIAPELLNGGDLPSYILLGRNAGWGTGTNMVGELYRSFGSIGMCLYMYGLGVLLRRCYYLSNRNIYCYAFYMLMVGHTAIYPRASFLYDPRTIVWSLLLLWLVLWCVRRGQSVQQTTADSDNKPLTRIVYCIPHLYNSGGMERVLTQKANYLAALPDMHIRIVTTEPVPEGMPLSYFALDERIEVEQLCINFGEDFGLPLLRKYYRHCRKQRRYRHALRDILLRDEADICISLSGKEIEWLGELDVPCRKVAEIHFALDYRDQLFRQYHPGLVGRCIGRYLTHQLVGYMQQIDHLVVLTQADCQAWEQAGVKHVSCIPNPSALTPSLEGRHDKKQLLAVGRLHPQKGFDMLLEAWQQLVPKYPDWVLRIAGEGDCRNTLEQQIEQLGLQDTVCMKGLSRDIQKDYQESRLFVLSSRWEGLPLALIEAMSQGCCCVAFDCPQGPRELIQEGVTGRLVPNGDIPALVQVLDGQMRNEEESARIGAAAYDYASTHFATEPIMNQWKKLLGLCN